MTLAKDQRIRFLEQTVQDLRVRIRELEQETGPQAGQEDAYPSQPTTDPPTVINYDESITTEFSAPTIPATDRKKRKTSQRPNSFRASTRTRNPAAVSDTSDPNSIQEFQPDWHVWVEDGKLSTDTSVDQTEWYRLEEAFRVQAHQYPDWHQAENPVACAFSPRTKWTVKRSGDFACKNCYNSKRICAKWSEARQRHELLRLPLPPGLTHHVSTRSFVRSEAEPLSSAFTSVWQY